MNEKLLNRTEQGPEILTMENVKSFLNSLVGEASEITVFREDEQGPNVLDYEISEKGVYFTYERAGDPQGENGEKVPSIYVFNVDESVGREASGTRIADYIDGEWINVAHYDDARGRWV